MKTILEYLQSGHINGYESDMPRCAVSKDENMKNLLHLQLMVMSELPKVHQFLSDGSMKYFSTLNGINDLKDAVKKNDERPDSTVWKITLKDANALYDLIGKTPLLFDLQAYIYMYMQSKETLIHELEKTNLQLIYTGSSKLLHVGIESLYDLDIMLQVLIKLYSKE